MTRGTGDAQRHASIRLLYVEDDEATRSGMEMLLANEGFDVVAVSTANEALDALRRQPYQLLLTDYNLPDKNADWLLGVARDHDLLRATAVIVLSGASAPKGIDDYQFLRKPVDITLLFATLENAVETGRAGWEALAPVAKASGLQHDAQPSLQLAMYITSTSRESRKAMRNLHRVLAKFDPASLRLNVYDLAHARESPLVSLDEDRIVVTPTLVRTHPLPKVWVLGNLSKLDLVEDMIAAVLEPRSPTP